MTNYTPEQYEKDKQIVANAPQCTDKFGIALEGQLVALFQCRESQEWMYWTDFEWSPTELEIGETLIPAAFIRQKIALYEQLQKAKHSNTHEALRVQLQKANARISELEDIAAELSMDLECEIEGRYAGMINVPHERPCTRADYECDMEPVERSKKIIGKIDR